MSDIPALATIILSLGKFVFSKTYSCQCRVTAWRDMTNPLIITGLFVSSSGQKANFELLVSIRKGRAEVIIATVMEGPVAKDYFYQQNGMWVR